ncbi:MAG TPA: helix-turn-helix domain-containing protein [Parvularculaceae bacterium]|nr:helix-turn-helix transcriptional regulator [Caulobacterales bacterium]HPE29844.1 helix-turn-helix domain-containing protein [Parvularculaceae bacterium]HRX40610.1 helix-turn-helix domain-containing protein [Parvularculaceae bacterium]
MTRTYNQACMLAYALDRLGERWTLLIVRDLILGPRGFVDLQTSLGGIGGSILSKRLKELEEIRLITAENIDGKRIQYRLTPLGESLRPTIRAMMLWSLRFMNETADPDTRQQVYETTVYKPDSLALALEIYAENNRAPTLSYVAHLIVDNQPYTVYYMAGEMTVRRGADSPAMAKIETDVETLLRGLRRDITPAEVRKLSHVEGDPAVLAHLLDCICSKRTEEKAA